MDHEERTAYAFGKWAVERKKRKPEDVSICRKSSNTLERLDNALRGGGFQRVEDIFENARTGRMAKRFGP